MVRYRDEAEVLINFKKISCLERWVDQEKSLSSRSHSHTLRIRALLRRKYKTYNHFGCSTKYFLPWGYFRSDLNPIRSSCNECRIHSLYRPRSPRSGRTFILSYSALCSWRHLSRCDFRACLSSVHRGAVPSRGRSEKEKAIERQRERGNWLCSHHADSTIVPWQRLDGRYFIQHKMQDNRLAWLESARLASTGLSLCETEWLFFSLSDTQPLIQQSMTLILIYPLHMDSESAT